MSPVSRPSSQVPGIRLSPAMEIWAEFWLMPARLACGLMASGVTAMAAATAKNRPPPPETDARIAREAEEQAAQIDLQAGETIPTPAALVA